MQLARFRAPDDIVLAGVVEDEQIVPLLRGDGNPGAGALIDLAMSHRRGELRRLKRAEPYAVDDVRILPPVPDPASIRHFDAFEEHVRTARRGWGLEMAPGWYESPIFSFANAGVVYGPGDDVPSPGASDALDYELEVVAVVGRDATDLDADAAAEIIAGYMIFNDFSARDVQAREMQQGIGPAKAKDFANAFGPYLVTPDHLEGGEAGRPKATMCARRNGRELSCGELGDIHWSFAEMIAHASRDSRVRRGDLIGSGAVGAGCLLELRITRGEDEHPWLRPGDEVELEVEGLGVLRNRIVERGT